MKYEITIHEKDYDEFVSGKRHCITAKDIGYRLGDEITLVEVEWGWGSPPTGRKLEKEVGYVSSPPIAMDIHYCILDLIDKE